MEHSTIQRLVPLTAALFFLPACGGDDDDATGGTGGIAVQISGEEAATDGFLFPTGSEVAFADGWELHFSHLIVTIDDVTLSENPDKAPTDQSQTDTAVARAKGPWAIDLAIEGTVPGAGGEGLATPLTTIANQTLNGGKAFALDRRYAFGFSIVEATDAATRVNFEGDAEANAAYDTMISEGYAVYYVGTATFKGDSCETSDDGYDFDAVPGELSFELGFETPTSYLNCQNQDNDGDPFDGEEYQRGIAPFADRPATAQITLHAEHPWFSDVIHDSALQFDPMASRLVGKPSGTVLTLDDMTDDDPTALTDGAGSPLPNRVCDGSDLPAGAQRGFGVGSLPVNPSGDPKTDLRDYRDFVAYVQSTQGHLNGGEGLCYVRRNYPSPR